MGAPSVPPVGATDVGPTPGRILTRVDGDVVAEDGHTLDGLDIHGRVIVRGRDVRVTDCVIRGSWDTPPPRASALVDATAPGVQGLRVTRTEVAPQRPHPGWANGVAGHDFVLDGCDVHSCIDSVGLWNTADPSGPLRARITRSYLRGLAWWSASRPGVVHPRDVVTHNDCVQIHGGSGAVLEHSVLDARRRPDWGHLAGGAVQPIPQGNTGHLSAVMVGHVIGTVSGVTVRGCWIVGGNVPVNCGPAERRGTTHHLGEFVENTFTADSGMPGVTVLFDRSFGPGRGVDAGEKTARANRRPDGTEVRVLYTG